MVVALVVQADAAVGHAHAAHGDAPEERPGVYGAGLLLAQVLHQPLPVAAALGVDGEHRLGVDELNMVEDEVLLEQREQLDARAHLPRREQRPLAEGGVVAQAQTARTQAEPGQEAQAERAVQPGLAPGGLVHQAAQLGAELRGAQIVRGPPHGRAAGRAEGAQADEEQQNDFLAHAARRRDALLHVRAPTRAR